MEKIINQNLRKKKKIFKENLKQKIFAKLKIKIKN